MFFENINYITVLIAALIAMGLGFVWYSPLLFAKRWMKEMNYTPEGLEELKRKNSKAGMAKTYSIGFFIVLLTAYIFAALLNSLIVTGIGELVSFAFFVWIAFSMPVAINSVLYGKDSFALFAINSGYQLVSLALMSLVIGIFG